MFGFKASRYLTRTQPIADTQTGKQNRVVYSTSSGAIRLVSELTWQAMMSGQLERIPDTVLADLVQAEFLVSADEDELRTILERNAAAAADVRTAYLVIQPTAACQFGCGYCGQTHRARFISDDHQDKLVARARTMLSSGRYDSIQVAWFGGEPTLALNQMRALTERLRAVAAERGCRYDAKMVSNGYLLTEDVVTELVAGMGVSSIEITIDGTREDHDRSRPTKGGGPTFDRVFGNAVAIARRTDIQARLTIRCNVSRSNRGGAVELLELLAFDGVQDKVNVYTAPIHDWGNSARADYGTSMKDFAEWEVEFLIRAVQLGFRPKLLPGRKTINCLTFTPGAEMIDAYGNRFNCTEVSYVDAYEAVAPVEGGRMSLTVIDAKVRSNRYAIGHLDRPDDIPGRKEILGDFYTDVERGRYDCHECPMLPTCGGHCPKSWVEGTPACPSPKFNIEERLQIFYAMRKGALDADHADAD